MGHFVWTSLHWETFHLVWAFCRRWESHNRFQVLNLPRFLIILHQNPRNPLTMLLDRNPMNSLPDLNSTNPLRDRIP